MTRLLAILLAACATGRWVAPAQGATEDDVRRVLRDQRIAFDSNRVEQALAEALLKAVDPDARLIVDHDHAPSVAAIAEPLAEGSLYARIDAVQAGAGDAWIAELTRQAATNRPGLIVDLRGAEGTDLRSVDQMAGLFVAGGTPLYRVLDADGQPVGDHHAETVTSNAVGGWPAMFLIDRATGQAAELLAAVIQHRCRVMLIGQPTRGDGRLRERVPLTKTESVDLPIRRVALPDGNIMTLPVEPDILIATNEAPFVVSGESTLRNNGRPLSAKAEEDIRLMTRVQGDPALNRAVDILLGLRALRRSNDDVAHPQPGEAETTETNVPAIEPASVAPGEAVPSADTDEAIPKPAAVPAE